MIKTPNCNNNKANTSVIRTIDSSKITRLNNVCKFALDTAATRHVICNKAYFSDFKICNKTVNWGEAKQITIKGIGNVHIKFNDLDKIFILKDCLYMLELSINLIS